MSLAARFLAAFNPAPQVHGVYETFGERTEGKKWKGKADSVSTPVTIEEVERHLAGERRIGFAPLWPNGTLFFAAIDIDQYEKLDLAGLAKKVRRLMLPLIVCKTKSGGAHLYTFFDSPQAAGPVREKMSDWSAALYPKGKVEIFPKQSKLTENAAEGSAKGNWINVPYFGDATFAIDEDGNKLELEAFLDCVERIKPLAAKAISGEEELVPESGEFELDAAVAEILPHWTSDRHLLALMVSGALLRGGVAEERVVELIEAIVEAAKDEEPLERVNCVGIAAKAIANNAPMFGIPALVKRMGREPAQNFLRFCGISDGGTLSEMNEKYALIRWGGQVRVLTTPIDPETGWQKIELMGVDDLRLWLSNKPKIGKKTQANWWIAHPGRRQYEGVVFKPGSSAPSGYLNLWSGWGVVPGGPRESCEPWLEMVREVIAAGNEEWYKYIIGWCADAIQNPTERPGVTLVLRGKQGAGKGTFARIFGQLFGRHFLHIRHSRHLVGNFNSHLINALLVFADEALYPGDKAGEGALKGLITEPTTPIEYKGKDVISVANYIRVIMASNHDWVVPAGLDDRRFPVFDVDEKVVRDAKYFARVNESMKNGGLGALMEYLLNYDLSETNLRNIPETSARTDQQLMSMETVTAFVFSRLCETDAWAPLVRSADFFEEYRKHCGREWYANEISFGIRLKKLLPSIVKTTARDESGARHKCYRFGGLEQSRAEFQKATGLTVNWATYERLEETEGAPF